MLAPVLEAKSLRPVGSTVSVAEQAWASLSHLGIEPTPGRYALFYAYHSEPHSPLRVRLNEALSAERPPTSEFLDAMQAEHLADAAEMAVFDDGAEALMANARQLGERLSSDHEATREYGLTLSHWAGRLNERPSPEEVP